MSAKGLPPAVRLDPLPLLPTCPGGHMPFGASQAQRINSATSMPSADRHSPQPRTQTPARGLTPIIITPESASRPHTPAAGGSDRGTPGLSVMHTLTVAGTTGKPTKKHKFEFKLEPVELDPILPSGKAEEVKVKAVSMDDEDEGTKLPQLPPTPCMTPVLHPVDLTEGSLGGGEDIGDNRSPRTGRAILPAFRSRPDDPAVPAHRLPRNLSLSDLADVAERERLVCDEEAGRRGRTKERRRASRFREEIQKAPPPRYRPYDSAMRSAHRPVQSQPRSPRFHTSTHSMSSSHRLPPLPPSPHLPSPGGGPPPPIPHPPPSQQPPSLPPIAPPHPIPKAADHLIHLFDTELQNQIQAERDTLRSEYEHLIRERSELQRERELMWRQRAEQKPNDREAMDLREENRMLRIRVEELQVRLDSMLREMGRPATATADKAMKPTAPQ